MSKALEKARTWFNLEGYIPATRKLPDMGLYLYLLDRHDLYTKLRPFWDKDTDYYKSRFFPCHTDEYEPHLHLKNIKTQDETYQRIISSDIQSYETSSNLYGQIFPSITTPEWLASKNYYCSSVRPTSIVEMVHNAELVKKRQKFDTDGYTYKEILKLIKLMNREGNDKLILPNKLSYSYDEYLIDQTGIHTQDIHLSIDLSASNKQILSEISKLLPLIRELVSEANCEFMEDNLMENDFSLSGLKPLNTNTAEKRLRETRFIDLIKVRDYLMPAIIDLHIWSLVEQETLSGSDYGLVV